MTSSLDRSEIEAAVEKERTALVDDLAQQDPSAWDAMSLCEGWRVRDVVGHLLRVHDFYRRPYTFEWDLVRFGFRLNAALAKTGVQIGSRPTTELLDALGSAAYERTTTFRLHPWPAMALGEWIVHGQDIRRPLGLHRTFDPSSLAAVAEVSLGRRYPWGRQQRIKGVRLRATDADWSAGSGPDVHGPLEAIVMALTGRSAAIDDLAGEGLALLR